MQARDTGRPLKAVSPTPLYYPLFWRWRVNALGSGQKKSGVPGPPLGAHHPGRGARPSIRLVGAHGSILATCPSDYGGIAYFKVCPFCHHHLA